MAVTIDIHPVQAGILRTLLFKPDARFSELNTSQLSNDHFTFHINKLVELQLITKHDKTYHLTEKGKEFANRMDTDVAKIEKQAKIGVLIVCTRKHNGKIEYLMQQRLKQPYYGTVGILGGKVRWGESIYAAAARELHEETGLTAKLTLAGIKHKMDYAQNNVLLEDKYFYIFTGINVSGEMIETFEGGNNMWITEKNLLALPNLIDGVKQTLPLIKAHKLFFTEALYIVDNY